MNLEIRGKKLSIYELVSHYALDPIETENNESFLYEVDVYRETAGEKRYFAKVYRREFFRLQLSFSKASDGSSIECDEELLVEDIARAWTESRWSSVEDVLQFVLQEIEQLFNQQV